jgi:glycosyltransferase involved in cell wall biosynthesis
VGVSTSRADTIRRQPRRLALLLPSVECGGAERIMVSLLRGLAERGVPVDLVLGRAQGHFLAQVPRDVRVVDLHASRMRWAIRALSRYLRSERPYALLSRMTHTNLAAICAVKLARTDVKLAIVEASDLSAQISSGKLNWAMQSLIRRLYPLADTLIGVSDGVSRDLERHLRLSPGTVHRIYNPVIDNIDQRAATEEGVHPWLVNREWPTFVAVGRLAAVKDYPTLLRAFAAVRLRRPTKLAILGEGPDRKRLEQLRGELDLQADVVLPGFTDNPYSWMSRASALVLSSRFEGLPNALIEALACGCPVVATDCPSGPREIVAGGEYGQLVPPGDHQALAEAMLRCLDAPVDRDKLRRRGSEFSLQHALPKYFAALQYPTTAPVKFGKAA